MGPPRDGSEPTVLLVGAGERFTPAFQAALSRYRVQVETAELGTVVDAVIVTAPDLVLLMGEAAKDGGAFVLQKLASLSQNFSVPVVVLNDDRELEQKLSAFRHGATAVLPRSASVDATAAEVAKLARELPGQSADAQGGLGEATLDEFVAVLSRQLRSGLVSSLSTDTGDADLKLVLGRGRPLSDFLDTFVRSVRRHVVRAEPLRYELGAGAPSADGSPRASLPASKPEIAGLRIVLADDDTPRADAVSQELRARGVTVVVTDLAPSGTRFQALRQADPAVLVIGEEHAHGAGYELLRRVRRDSRLRWASLLVVRWEEIWAEEGGAPTLGRLESTLAGLAEPERALLGRAEARVAFDTRLEATGPARCLRTLERIVPALRIHVDHPRVELTVDLSEGLVVGAEGRTLDAEAKPLAGVHALSALLVLGSGRVRIEPVAEAQTANVMTPVEAALAMADAETPPIAPSIPAAGTVSMHPPFQPEMPAPFAVPAPFSMPPSLRGSVRPTPIVPVGAPNPFLPPRPAASLGPPVAPPRAASRPAVPPPVALAPVPQPVAPAPPPVALAPAPHERNPPAMTVPTPLSDSSARDVRLGTNPPSSLPQRARALFAWWATQDAKLHGKRISRRMTAVLVALGALQGVVIVLIYAGARWLVGPHAAKAPRVALSDIAGERTPRPAPPEANPAAPEAKPAAAETKPEMPASAASAGSLSAPRVEPALSDGSGRDVPDCATLLQSQPVQQGFYPGAALQAMRAGRAAIVRGDLNAAQTALCRAAHYNSENAEIALELSLVLLLRRDGEGALGWAREAVRLDPSALGAKEALGDALARTGQEADARTAWLLAARVDESNEAGVRALVTRSAKQADFALRHRDLVTAEKAFRRTAILEPRSSAALSGLAYVLLGLGDVTPAVGWARRAVAVAPRSSGARLVLGDTLAKSGDKPAALREWRESALLDPTNREAQKRLRAAGIALN